MSEVQLLGAPLSPFSFRVEIALKLKGIQYDFKQEDYQSNKSPLLLKYNPVYKKIPVLVHNGKPLAESLVILEYIDETWDHTPLLPKDPYKRAQARFWAKFIDEKCLPGLRKIVYAGDVEEREKARVEVQELLKHLDDELNGKTFFGGESVGFVDIAAFVVGYWLEVTQEAAGLEVLTRQKHAKIYEWMEALSECSVIKENLPPRDKLLAYYQARFAGRGSFINQGNQ